MENQLSRAEAQAAAAQDSLQRTRKELEETRRKEVLYCTVLYCTVLYCTVLYCTVLYCTVLWLGSGQAASWCWIC